MRKFIVLSLVLSFLTINLLTLPASAIEYGGIGGKPANPQPGNVRTQSIFIFTLKPGEGSDDGVKIFNNTKQSRTISVYPVDSQLASGGAFSCAQKVEQKKDVGGWITMSQDKVTIPAGQSQVVPFTVTVPAKVDVGEHDGCIAMQDSSSDNKSDKGGVVLSFRSAIRVAVTIPGKIVKQLQILSITTHRTDGGNIIVAPTLKNTGNVSLDTKLTSSLAPILGAGRSSNISTYPILPRSSASWNFELKRPFWGGLYHATVKATYSTDPASGLGAKGGNLKTISLSSGMFFIAPAAGALVIELIVLVLILAAAAWLLRQRIHHHKVRRHWESYTVKDGDTINKVAKRFDVSWKRLARANKLRAPYALETGRRLRVPPTTKTQE